MSSTQLMPMFFRMLLISGLLALVGCSSAESDESDALASSGRHNDREGALTIERASLDTEDDRLTVRGRAPEDARIDVRILDGNGNAVDIDRVREDDDEWRYRQRPAPAPACVAEASWNGNVVTRVIDNRPADCDRTTPPPATACADGIDNDGDGLTDFPADPGCDSAEDGDEFNLVPPPPIAQCADGIDNDGDGLTDFPADTGCDSSEDNDETNAPASGPLAQCSDGSDNDGDGLIDFPNDPGCVNADDDDELNVAPPVIPDTSINSTSQNGIPVAAVAEQAFVNQAAYKIFASNDLGMHCGDLDTRISSILPPFNTVHSQVIRRAGEPDILTPADGVEVVYSAASNPNDPILSGINSAGSGPVASSLLADGSVFKTNFWNISQQAYDAFYPPGVLSGAFPTALDLGLPMPDVERLYLGDGALDAEQQAMPGRNGPYGLNAPLAFRYFVTDQPFFTNPAFQFGYVKEGVNWFEAAGIPLTAYDDFGRENPWPLMRVQARSTANGEILASIDSVLPISGEANCGGCHNAPIDIPSGNGTGIATAGMAEDTVVTSLDDPALDQVPMDVSREWAADMNILRLHDQKHGTSLESDIDPVSGQAANPIVCQSCHYTPALDLAQVGPNEVNGRDQLRHKTMSNVMHKHHGSVDINGNEPGDANYDPDNLLFPDMPPAVNPDGSLRNPVTAREVLNETCYQCHPGRRTDCLRGAMANGGMLCQDCHGGMQQVGDDFSRTVSLDSVGTFELAGDFYTNPDTPRVPWANEPGCGSCHTGDALNNMHGDSNTLGDPEDGIRLMQAFRIGDPKATPIVPANKRFAENVVDSGPAAGNPMLYRVSTGHEGVFCEACHGATHGIWPNKNPDANDNVAAIQLQGHAGTISECSVCHTGDLGNNLDGPHGMHPIGEAGREFASGGHEDLAEDNANACRACHGRNGEGTVLSAMKTDRVLECDERTAFCPDGNQVLFPAGHQVGCVECHGNEL